MNHFFLSHQNLAGEKPVMVIDEIGKMEMFSGTFTQTVRTLIAREDATVLATIPIAKGQPLPLVEELRTKKDAYIFTVRFILKLLFVVLLLLYCFYCMIVALPKTRLSKLKIELITFIYPLSGTCHYHYY